ncbi:MAG: class I SAM-dependent methyltransferase [Chloroflexi bacterium]|nr:class I SAM-dependent methyltransferase [Chloroflexota bacterium]
MASLLKRLFALTPMTRSTSAYTFGLERVGTLPSGPVLEIGTGQGYSVAFLSRALADRQVVGIDITYECFKPERLEFGPRKPWLVQASAPYLPFASDTFALVSLVMTFHCLPEPQRVFREVFRVLKPGGVLMMADVDGQHRIAPWFERIEHLGISSLTRAYRVEEILALGKEAGFPEPQIAYRKPGGFMVWYLFRKPQEVSDGR